VHIYSVVGHGYPPPPPAHGFNVQHNPGHEIVRVAFMAYRQAAEEHSTPADLVRAAKKRLPLLLVDDVDGLLTFRTTPIFGPVARLLVKPMLKIPVLFAGIQGGVLQSVEVEGPSAILRCAKRRSIGIGAAPFARLAIINTRDGSGTQFHVKSVQACDDHEYALLKEAVPA
jgi:hypothetical protein